MAMNDSTGKNYLKKLERENHRQLSCYHVDPYFPENVKNLGADSFCLADLHHREDYTLERTFTIDSEDCKDMDDAVSICQNPYGYRIGVHIADVSAFVGLGTELDKVAVQRSTSLYLPNMTIPMLPSVLSNDLCSLNPGVPRLTLSVIIHMNKRGEVINYEITKGKIISRVKGVYKEVNELLSGSDDEELKRKYAEVYEDLFDMYDIFKILREERIQRGSFVQSTNPPKIRASENDISLIPVIRGIAEDIVEEFMILANRLVAEYLYHNNLPAIFRVQEKGKQMAEYRATKLHHANLALESYSHFTSPIRRISDLKIHQVISMYLGGYSCDYIHKVFDTTLDEVCELATKKYRTVRHITRSCEKYCYRLFFEIHNSEDYVGICIGYDRQQRPIMNLHDFNIRIVGYSLISARIGEEYSFKIAYSESNKELFARKPKRIAA